ncbi:hypothetical protein D3C77_294370 [compost metagenome]
MLQPLLPLQILTKRNWLRQLWSTLLANGRISFLQLTYKYRNRPTVHDDMMEGKRQNMLFIGQMERRYAKQRLFVMQVECSGSIRSQPVVQLSLALARGARTKIYNGNRSRQIRQYHLKLAARIDNCPQSLMSSHQYAYCLPQCLYIQRTVHFEQDRFV